MTAFDLPAPPSVGVEGMSMLALAHVGDAVYELLVRSSLCAGSRLPVGQLHKNTVALVRAEAQAAAAALAMPLLSDEEAAIFRRGRNAHVNSVPKNAALSDYHAATALEALFGWLYLNGRLDRLRELFEAITQSTDQR